jgi:DNA-binding MurR/RpiR family transcriptional regulator
MSKLMAFDLISRLRELDGTFNAREQRVASYVIENLEEATQLTVSEMAKVCGVSEPTVIRFCRTLGCAGVRDFKLRLAQNVAVSLQYLEPVSPRPAGDGQGIDQILGVFYATANVARAQLDDRVLAAAVEAVAAARRVIFCGVGGGSATVAFDAANRFFRLGIPATAVHDGYQLRMQAATLAAGDLLFCISSSGDLEELIESARIARQYGAIAVSLTRPGSALAEACDIAIGLKIPEDPDIYKPTASRLVYLVIIDVLAAAVARKNSDVALEKLRRIRASLAAVRGRTEPQPIGD